MARPHARLLDIPVGLVAIVLLAALLAVAWFDYSAARGALVTLSRAHAASVRDTVTAAARANRAAALDAESALTARLLDHARLVAAIDGQARLSQDVLDEMLAGSRGLRVAVLGPDGRREIMAGARSFEGRRGRAGAGPGGGGGPGGGRGIGPGGGGGAGPGGGGAGPGGGRGIGPGGGGGTGPGAGLGLGPGFGAGPGTARLAEQLLSGEATEVVTDVHTGRWGDTARLTAGVRRRGGGAILVGIDADVVSDLQAQASIDRLLGDLVTGNPEIAYLSFQHGDVRYSRGEVPATVVPATPAAPTASAEAGQTAAVAAPTERVLDAGGREVLDLTGPIDVADGVPTSLTVGVRLDALRATERRTLVRLAVSLTSAMALGVMALGFIWLRREYGTLSERHFRAEQALRRRDRLAAMGEMASTVAHEIRNPLNAIAMSAQRLARESFSGDSTADGDLAEARGLVGVITQEADRINRRVQEFLEFARAPRLDVRAVDIEPWMDDLAASARSFADGHQVNVETTLEARGRLEVDPDQLRQALDNIMRNAVEATPEDGHVTVTSRIVADHLIVDVTDTGPGIAAEDLPRIFDLYFTTKADGTGIGLAVSQQIIGAHGGTIDVGTGAQGGTRMTVRVPLVAGETGRG